MNQQALFLKALQLKPDFARAYHNLGVPFVAGGSLQLLDGTLLTKEQLYLKARALKKQNI